MSVEVGEERKVSPDVFDGQIVGVGENIGRDALAPQFGVECDHRRHFPKDIGEVLTELRQVALKAGGLTDFVIKFMARQQAGFVTVEQGRMIEKLLDLGRRHVATRGNAPASDGVIKVHEHFAEIENNDGGFDLQVG